MTPRQLRHPLASALLLMVLAWTVEASAIPTTFTASGATPGDIQGSVDSFRNLLGNPNNGNNPGGRREINWDGGGRPPTAPSR